MNILNIVLDENNHDPIVFQSDENNKYYRFEQIAAIPYNEKIYCILKPIDQIKNVQKNEALVFYIDEQKDTPELKLEENELTSLRVFEIYYNLLEKKLDEEG